MQCSARRVMRSFSSTCAVKRAVRPSMFRSPCQRRNELDHSSNNSRHGTRRIYDPVGKYIQGSSARLWIALTELAHTRLESLFSSGQAANNLGYAWSLLTIYVCFWTARVQDLTFVLCVFDMLSWDLISLDCRAHDITCMSAQSRYIVFVIG